MLMNARGPVFAAPVGITPSLWGRLCRSCHLLTVECYARAPAHDAKTNVKFGLPTSVSCARSQGQI